MPARIATGDPTHEKLSEDEVNFCWRCIADRGQLCIKSLQKFMLEVCGEEPTDLQARDLIWYMDANGDGRVGMEDFRNFMSIGRLVDTDPKNFMWTPKAKYRELHGIPDKLAPVDLLGDTGLQATMNLFATTPSITPDPGTTSEDVVAELPEYAPDGRRLLPHTQQRPTVDHTPADHAAGHAQSGAQQHHGSFTVGHRGSRKLPHTPHAPHAPQGPRRRTGRPGSRASPAEEEPATPPVVLLPREERPREKPRPKGAPVNPKMVERIDAVLERYEEASWQRFLREEDEFKRRIFAQFTASETSNEMASTEFHRMLTRWSKISSRGKPGVASNLRAADSLATMEYISRRDKSRANYGSESGAAAAAQSELKLTYRLWLEILNGKHRPEVNITVPTRSASKESIKSSDGQFHTRRSRSKEMASFIKLDGPVVD